MSQNRWTAEQDQYLIDHWQSQSDRELAEMVGHTAASVNARRQRLGLKHRESSKGPDWSREEVELMQELWGTYTIPQIAKRLNRSVLAVKVKSTRLGLGRYVNSSQYITANQAAGLLHVDIHCRNCNHKMDLGKPYLAYTHCECGQAGRYLTNIPDFTFDIPCATCGSPNTVTYHRGKDCYVPVGHAQKHGRAKKKK